jgi:hypothetical protein
MVQRKAMALGLFFEIYLVYCAANFHSTQALRFA